MKDELNYARSIDKYLDGIMNDSEKYEFEKKLSESTELKAEFDLFGKVNALVADRDAMEMQSQLDAIHNELYGDKPVIKMKPRFYRRLAVAASVAVLVSAGLYTYQKNASLSSGQIVEKFYQPVESNNNFRGAVENETLEKALLLYDNKQFSEAIAVFEKILEGDQSRIGLNLYSGVSHMELKKYSEANKRFNKIIDHKNNMFLESAHWYLGMSYLQTDDREKAADMFEEVVKIDGYYKKDAKKILRKID